MNKKHKQVWDLALPYLEKGRRKNFVVHTKGVVRAMEMILKKEKGDKNILVPAAILHDVGWAKVPVKIQKNWLNKKDKLRGEKMHLEFAGSIIERMLRKMKYDEISTHTILRIVRAHKSEKPKDIFEELLIDADRLSDILKEQFYSDAKSFNVSAEKQLEFRKKNRFFSKTAKEIFDKEFKKRAGELKLN